MADVLHNPGIAIGTDGAGPMDEVHTTSSCKLRPADFRHFNFRIAK